MSWDDGNRRGDLDTVIDPRERGPHELVTDALLNVSYS